MAKKASNTITLNTAKNGFPVNHYFNRFATERSDDGVLVHLGYKGADSFLMGAFSFFVPTPNIERQKESILRYIDDIEYKGDEVKQIAFPASDRPVHTVRFFHASRTGPQSELLLYNIPILSELNGAKTPDEPLTADPLAAFSSPLSTHVSLLKEIFAS